MRTLATVIAIILLASCSPASKLRRAEKLIKRAELAGAVWSSDTVFKEIPVFIERVALDTVFVPKVGDTVVLTKDRLQVKYVRLRGDTVFIDAECLPDTIKVNVPTIINREITAECRIKWWHVLIGFVVGAILGRFVIRLLV